PGFRARRPVVADAAGVDEDARRRRRSLDRLDETAGRKNAAVAEEGLSLRRPPLVAQRLSREVDHRIGIVHDLGPGAGRAVRPPSHPRDPRFAGAWIVPCFTFGEAPREHTNIVPFFRVDLRDRAADEPGSPGNHESHTAPLTHARTLEFALYNPPF